jgi:hypothetical protein
MMPAISAVFSRVGTAMHLSVMRMMARRINMKRNVFAMAIISIALLMFVPSNVRRRNRSRVLPVRHLLIILASMASSAVRMVEMMLERASLEQSVTVMKGP